jgi:hypothetical protein
MASMMAQDEKKTIDPLVWEQKQDQRQMKKTNPQSGPECPVTSGELYSVLIHPDDSDVRMSSATKFLLEKPWSPDNLSDGSPTGPNFSGHAPLHTVFLPFVHRGRLIRFLPVFGSFHSSSRQSNENFGFLPKPSSRIGPERQRTLDLPSV